MKPSNRTLIGILAGLTVVLCICLGMFFFVSSFLGGDVHLGTESPIQAGKNAPNFSLVALNGQEINLEDLHGKPILLNFWTAWCHPCQAEMPLLESTSKKYSNLQIVGINVGDSPAKVENYASAEHLSFTILLDEDEEVSKVYTITGFPTSIFIDKEGIIQSLVLGELSTEELEENLAQIGIK